MDAPLPPARWQESEEPRRRVGGIVHNKGGGLASPDLSCNYGLSVWKSRIQFHIEVFRLSKLSNQVHCCGMIALNAELKSMNKILT